MRGVVALNDTPNLSRRAVTPVAVLLVPVRDRTPEMFAVGIAADLTVHSGLAALYVRRFAAAMNLEARSPSTADRTSRQNDWLRPPFTAAWRAIAGKQVRESGPLVLVGLVAILVVISIFFAGDYVDTRRLPPTPALVRVYTGIAMMLGVFVTLVAGIGVALNDPALKLNAFWRSRPVHPDLWFWTKYLTGLLLLPTTIYLPAILLAVMLHQAGLQDAWEPNELLFPSLQIALFSTALALTCLLRNAIYAAILSIAVIYVGVLPAPSRWRDDYREWDVPVALSGTAAIMTIVGWLAMRNDWGSRR